MKNKLPRKYRITCRVRPLDAPENIAFPRDAGMYYGDTDDSTHHNGVRNVGRLYQADNDNRRRVCRLDAPENIVSSRYVGMHNGDADDTKMAETLVLSGFAGGGGAPI